MPSDSRGVAATTAVRAVHRHRLGLDKTYLSSLRLVAMERAQGPRSDRMQPERHESFGEKKAPSSVCPLDASTIRYIFYDDTSFLDPDTAPSAPAPRRPSNTTSDSPPATSRALSIQRQSPRPQIAPRSSAQATSYNVCAASRRSHRGPTDRTAQARSPRSTRGSPSAPTAGGARTR